VNQPASQSIQEFVWEWFAEGPRSLGTPEQRLVDGPEAVYPWLDQRERPVWLSVSTYYPDKTVWNTDRVFFDFDAPDLNVAWADARRFAGNISHNYGLRPFIVFSGKKGYHVYVFLLEPVGDGLTDALKKRVYGELQAMLIGAHSYPTLDRAVIGDYKRVARVPYSVHEKTGNLVVPVDEKLGPIQLTRGYVADLRRCGIQPSLVNLALRRIEKRCREQDSRIRKRVRVMGDGRKLRPCMEAVLNASNTHGPHQKLKVAACAEAFAKGWSEPEIIGKFAAMSGYDEKITRKQVESSRHYTPYKCVTIQ